jgi:NAD+ synthase
LRTAEQQDVIRDLGVAKTFDAADEIARRVTFLTAQLTEADASGYVLGISGGVDSFTAGGLCQVAVERLRQQGVPATFVAMRLPYRMQTDEEDARRAIAALRPDVVLTVNIGPASDALAEALHTAGAPIGRIAGHDFVLGNIKARQRMAAQYAVANAHGMLVVGTDHAAEAVLGFFTKHGDGACDVTPLSGLTKRRVRLVARELGADDRTITKLPTADLESDHPGLPDEEALGLTYDDVDDFLEGHEVAGEIHDQILALYRRTEHKRKLPASPLT